MKCFAVLSLVVVVLFNLSSGIHVADDEEIEAIADAHNRVVRAMFINPSGIFAAQTRASTYSRSTRSSGLKRSTPTVGFSTSTTSSYPTPRSPSTSRVVTTRPITETSPVMGGMNITSMFNSTICRQAYVEVIDQCITAQGLNLTEVTMVFSFNNTAADMPLLNRLINILCGSSGCKDSFLNVYQVCFPGISGSPYMKYMNRVFDVLCYVNEYGSTCAKTYFDLATPSSLNFSVCLMNRRDNCMRLDSPCRSVLQAFSASAGCCALETYQLYVEGISLFIGNSTGSFMPSFPPNPWTACGLPSPGQCRGGFTTGTPTVPIKPPVIVTSPTPKVPSKTIFLPRGRVWPYTDPSRFITVGKLKRRPSKRIAVLAANDTKWQRWAIAFDSDLQSRTQFLIISYPVPKYIVKVVSIKRSSYRLALERTPKKKYVSGAPFNNPGSSYIFTSKNCYRNSRFSGQYIQHVATGLALTHNSGSRIFLSPLQSSGNGQCWMYPDLQKWLG